MRRWVYIICIALIAASFLLKPLVTVSAMRPTEYAASNIQLRQIRYAMKTIMETLTNPVPFLLSQYVPEFIETLLKWTVALATGRRIYLWVRAGEMSAPAEMTRLQLGVIVLALASLALVLINQVLVPFGFFLLVPIAFYAIGGVFLLVPAILWVEFMSLRNDLQQQKVA